MKILRVISSVDPAMGGPTNSAINSTVAAHRTGAHTTVVFAADEAFQEQTRALAAKLEREGIAVESFPFSRLFAARARRWAISFPMIVRVLRSTARFDVVHAHGAWTFTALAGLVAARVSRRSAVLSTHEALTEFDIAKSSPVLRVVKRLLRRLYVRTFDLIVVSSGLEARDSLPGGSGGRILVAPHPVEALSGLTDLRASPARHGLRVGYLGRFDRKKNLDVLIHALAGCPESVTLRVAGAGALEQELRILAQSLEVASRIQWVGFIGADEKPGFFTLVDVLVMPSAYECFGMAAAEAMAHSVPVIVSESTGIAEIVRRTDSGLIVRPEPDALRIALASLLDDPTRLRALATNALKAATEELSLAVHGQRLAAAYRRLLGEAPSEKISRTARI